MCNQIPETTQKFLAPDAARFSITQFGHLMQSTQKPETKQVQQQNWLAFMLPHDDNSNQLKNKS